METSAELSVPNDRIDIVEKCVERVFNLFSVTVRIEPEVEGSPNRRVILMAGAQNPLEKAKEYVSAVCLPDADKCQLQCQYTTDVYNRLHQLRDDIERESLVTLTFGDNQTINVCGQQPQVVAALALLEQKTREFLSDDAGGSSSIVGGGKGPQGDLSRTSSGASTGAPATKHRWKLESEDSSYDSDYENSETLSPRDPKEDGGSFHDEVSRTVSDTLAAEFAEYVNVRGGKQAGDETWPAGLEEQDEEEAAGNGSDFLDVILSDPNYTSRVEFALKLGYTEQQVQIALQKLGPQPGQNELLAELIKLGANSKSLDLQAAGAEDSGSSDDLSGCLDSRIRSEIPEDLYNLRPVVIDGSNVAMSHGNKEIFSCRGIKLCVDWFKSRGHKEITVFVPKWRKEASRPDARITDQDILLELEKERRLVFTPSRLVGGRRLVCYDDRYILKLAVETDGIVVSNDNYRDLANETPEFKKVVEERLLMYSFVNDRFMPPDDPLGRHGPNLENFLRKQPKLPESLPPPCPYGKKCTYGNKCKYYHPERGNLPQKSVTERLVEQAKIQIQEVKARGNKSRDSSPGDSLKQKLTSTVSAPSGMSSETKQVKKTPLSRTRSVIPQSLLPKELTESSIAHPTRDDNSEPSDVRLEGSSSGHENSSKPLDPLISSGQMSGGDTQVPGFLNMPGGPSGFNTQTGIPPSWTSSNQQQSWTPHGLLNTMCNITPGGHPSGLFYNDPGGHLSVAKRLSDPDSSQNVHNEGTNLHRKLQRQLTLNPSYDPRLYQMHGFVPSPHLPDYPNRTMKSEAECRTDSRMHPLPLGVDSHDSTLVGGHRPLTRHSSATENRLPASAVPAHLCWLDSSNVGASGEGVHASVTRIASAPDSYRQWPPQHHRGAPMQRLNSTSDTQLNLSSYLGEVYEQESMWNVQTARPAAATHTQWHHDSQKGIPRPHTPLGHMLQPLRPSSVPPHQVTNPNHQTAPSICGEDLRNRLYYHLSSIFPKEQVQAAMRMYPEETNPQKICAAILSMFPPKGH